MKIINFAKAAIVATCLACTAIAHAQGVTANAIEAINVAQQGGEIAVKIDLKEALQSPPAGFSIANPAKIAFDFPSTANGLGKNSQTVNEGDLRSLNVVQVGERTRLVLNLVRNMNYTTRLEGKSLYVTLAPIVRDADSSALRSHRFAEETITGVHHSLQDVNFRRGKDGEARIVVELSDTGTGIDIRQQGSSLIVDFAKTLVPEHLRRKLDVTDFGTPVTAIETRTKGENAQMTISPKGLWEHNAYQSDNQFIIEVKKVVENSNKLVSGSKIGYQGPRVSINYQNGDVRALLRLMAEELGFNAVISETVTGTTTLVLKDVPADQVVDIIFQQKGLDMRKSGNVIQIAPREELMIRAKLEIEAADVLEQKEQIVQEIFKLSFAKVPDVMKILTGDNASVTSVNNLTNSVTTLNRGQEARKGLLTPGRGSANFDLRTNTLFVNDTATALIKIREIIGLVDVPVKQVLIEARIVEAADSFSRNLGVRLGFLERGMNAPRNNTLNVGANYQNTAQAVGIVQGTPTMPLAQQVNLPASPRSGIAGALSFILFNASSSNFLNLEITALEADGRGKVISSPRVMTADQIEALIEQGVEIPYQQATSSGATSVSFRKANLSLKVKPQITPDGKITLSLDINKDTPNPTLQTGSGVAIDTKHVKTEVLVDNGGTVVIGGIFTQNSKNQSNKIPLLGDIPYLGWLFKNNEIIDDKTELLIFITPKIVSEQLGMR